MTMSVGSTCLLAVQYDCFSGFVKQGTLLELQDIESLPSYYIAH